MGPMIAFRWITSGFVSAMISPFASAAPILIGTHGFSAVSFEGSRITRTGQGKSPVTSAGSGEPSSTMMISRFSPS